MSAVWTQCKTRWRVVYWWSMWIPSHFKRSFRTLPPCKLLRYTHTHTRTHLHTHMYTHTHTRTYTRKRHALNSTVQLLRYTFAHKHTHMQKHAHTHTHAHTHVANIHTLTSFAQNYAARYWRKRGQKKAAVRPVDYMCTVHVQCMCMQIRACLCGVCICMCRWVLRVAMYSHAKCVHIV